MNVPSKRIGLLLLAVTGLSAVSLGVVAQGEGQIVLESSVQTETRTVSYANETHTVSSVGRVQAGDPLTALVTVPSEVQSLRLSDGNGSVVTERRVRGDDSVTLSTRGLAPGEYVVSTRDENGTTEDAVPVVVAGYETTLSVRGSAGYGPTVFSVTPREVTAAPAVDDVRVVVRGPDGISRMNATESGDGNYTALATLDPGSYRVYAEVYAGDRVVGTSDSIRVRVSNETTTVTRTPENGTVAEDATTSANETPETTQSTAENRTAVGNGTTTENGTADANRTQRTGTPAASVDDAGNATSTGGIGDLGGPGVTNALGGRFSGLTGSPLLLVGALVGGLVLSTAAYQTLYALRRR
ncbi:hypothetical protein ACFO0N_15615 [Halobium salinum]|uniref:Carboxypeptidase regulatory-like domain-containing protein n=1 Tax=Halobium salinum TaxID=1364940 RepID=A0ABD5PEM0_9EURY|nr:hypothetical protein [Halobium salinum]